ncbi:2361_t:CDS:2 [Cetraspora pellucida]|uniref:2361_t:CDS:1 n=1 Tax=Cetraspora pellucida TaxID=1433469 RepID=A0A9N9FWK6_9GLOM|nr:2361_t:CDS:2 [Cetraspora pellucida]
MKIYYTYFLKEYLEGITNVQITATRNQIIGLANNKVQVPLYEQSESGILNLIIKKWTEDNSENKNKEFEEISIGILDTIDILNCHPADYENSKLELQNMFCSE